MATGAAALLLLTACGAGGTPQKVPSRTPDQAFTTTRDVVADVLDAVQQGASKSIGDSDRNVPCGGVGGNEHTKVRGDVTGEVMLDAPDLAAASKRAERVLSAAGWKSSSEVDGGRLVLDFIGDTGSASLIVGAGGKAELLAESICLPNPSSEDPFPDVQPRESPS